MPSLSIDSHCHFDVAAFDPDRDACWARARDAGVGTQVVPAIDRYQWEKVRDVARRYPGIHPAYGLHPVYLDRHQPGHLEELADWLGREQAVAVGECGLDCFVEGLDFDDQWTYFTAQLDLAVQFGLPVIVHARRAVDKVTRAVRERPCLTGVVHSFSGSRQQADKLLEQGMLLGFGGPITYPRAQRLRRLVSELPLEGILVETDAPDQPSASHRGERNEPAFLPEIIHTLAQLRDDNPLNVARVTADNARRLFQLPASSDD
ncbi:MULTISPECIES: TatD family hydrolase [unclassified Ectothiorhodospira]|uniref:TatD family hydrolase n=1 Tax=unclassified Ectothiorhodospira TaxID=2684909 RepID=UPI001EE9946E|nr:MULTISPECIES: TatD family hydrolase [unclassified Ectothiorhodospira]MCG5516172.1 TatD family hydrolase [Ectothiorhodospira sp. 9100]MCG5519600.1 TatD family hydrolase [Ectothiorhodospira sp. 9905]